MLDQNTVPAAKKHSSPKELSTKKSELFPQSTTQRPSEKKKRSTVHIDSPPKIMHLRKTRKNCKIKKFKQIKNFAKEKEKWNRNLKQNEIKADKTDEFTEDENRTF